MRGISPGRWTFHAAPVQETLGSRRTTSQVHERHRCVAPQVKIQGSNFLDHDDGDGGRDGNGDLSVPPHDADAKSHPDFSTTVRIRLPGSRLTSQVQGEASRYHVGLADHVMSQLQDGMHRSRPCQLALHDRLADDSREAFPSSDVNSRRWPLL